MITDGKNWHYLALKSLRRFVGEKWCNRPVRSLSRLLWGITSNHDRGFYCLNWHHADNKLILCHKHDYCHEEMTIKILKYNHGEKSLKAPFTIYVDLESLLKKYIPVKIFQKSFTQKKNLRMKLQGTYGIYFAHSM